MTVGSSSLLKLKRSKKVKELDSHADRKNTHTHPFKPLELHVGSTWQTIKPQKHCSAKITAVRARREPLPDPAATPRSPPFHLNMHEWMRVFMWLKLTVIFLVGIFDVPWCQPDRLALFLAPCAFQRQSPDVSVFEWGAFDGTCCTQRGRQVFQRCSTWVNLPSSLLKCASSISLTVLYCVLRSFPPKHPSVNTDANSVIHGKICAAMANM